MNRVWSGHTTSTGQTGYTVPHHPHIVTTPITVSVPFGIPLADAKLSAFAPRLELLYEVLRYSTWNLVRLAATCKFNRIVVRHHLPVQEIVGRSFLHDPEGFYDRLSDSGAVFSGFAALHLLPPAADTTWTPSNIHLYVNGFGYWKLERWLAGQGFRFLRMGDRDHSAYSHSEISEVITLTDGRHPSIS